ncbi:MAG: hypothetical protein RSF79_09515, partial [Janthinobacterium sp.]
MNRRIISVVLSTLLLSSGLYSASVRADESIPIADFFKKAEFSGRPILSPDGQSMAVLTPRNGRFVLADLCVKAGDLLAQQLVQGD